VVAAVEARPEAAFLAFAAAHAAVWTALPALLCRNLPLDVIEAVAYGQEWQIGYWKHPPLPWWLVDAVRSLGGTRIWPLFLLGQAAAVLCFWAIWRLARAIVPPVEALVAVVLLDGCVVFTVHTMEFNHNIVQLPVWGLAGWSLYRALTGERRLDWILTGLWLALAFYAKYTAVSLVLPLVLFSALDPRARRCWRTSGPYLALLVFFAVLAPHLQWLVRTDFGPIAFGTNRAVKAHSVAEQVVLTVDTVVSSLSLGALVGVLFLALLGRRPWRPADGPPVDPFARRYVAALALGPFATAVVASIAMGLGLQTKWASQFWPFIGLFLVVAWRPAVDGPALRRLGAAWAATTVLLMGSQAAAQYFHVGGGGRWATQFPGDRLAAIVTDTWHRETGQPLAYVVGDFWLGGNVIFFSSDRPHLFHDANLLFSPWIDLADVRRRGAVLLFPPELDGAEELALMRSLFPAADRLPPLVLRVRTPRGERTWQVEWALVRPGGA
jgi:hypothetical protein